MSRVSFIQAVANGAIYIDTFDSEHRSLPIVADHGFLGGVVGMCYYRVRSAIITYLFRSKQDGAVHKDSNIYVDFYTGICYAADWYCQGHPTDYCDVPCVHLWTTPIVYTCRGGRIRVRSDFGCMVLLPNISFQPSALMGHLRIDSAGWDCNDCCYDNNGIFKALYTPPLGWDFDACCPDCLGQVESGAIHEHYYHVPDCFCGCVYQPHLNLEAAGFYPGAADNPELLQIWCKRCQDHWKWYTLYLIFKNGGWGTYKLYFYDPNPWRYIEQRHRDPGEPGFYINIRPFGKGLGRWVVRGCGRKQHLLEYEITESITPDQFDRLYDLFR